MHSHPGNIKNTKQVSGYSTKGYLGDMKSIAERYEDLQKIGRKYPKEFPSHYIYHVESKFVSIYTWGTKYFYKENKFCLNVDRIC